MPKASGVQSSELIMQLAQQEVEGEPGEAGDQEQRVAADEAVLDGADDAAGAADHVPSVPVTRPSTTKRSKTRLAKRPIASAGRTISRSISSSKYHLLTNRV